MKDFVLDSTYKEITVVNSNDDIFNTSSSNLPYKSIPHHTIHLNKTNSNYNSNHHKCNKFDPYNLIDYL